MATKRIPHPAPAGTPKPVRRRTVAQAAPAYEVTTPVKPGAQGPAAAPPPPWRTTVDHAAEAAGVAAWPPPGPSRAFTTPTGRSYTDYTQVAPPPAPVAERPTLPAVAAQVARHEAELADAYQAQGIVLEALHRLQAAHRGLAVHVRRQPPATALVGVAFVAGVIALFVSTWLLMQVARPAGATPAAVPPGNTARVADAPVAPGPAPAAPTPLIIFTSGPPAAPPPPSARLARPGDTVATVATRLDVDPARVQAWLDNMGQATVYAGQEVPAADALPPATDPPATHAIGPGRPNGTGGELAYTGGVRPPFVPGYAPPATPIPAPTHAAGPGLPDGAGGEVPYTGLTRAPFRPGYAPTAATAIPVAGPPSP